MKIPNNKIEIISWNIRGLKSNSTNKIQDPEFLNNIDGAHILTITETHSPEEEEIEIPGYNLITKGSRRNKEDKGGVAIYAKNNISKYVQSVTKSSADLVWCMLPKNHFGGDSDIYIACFYSSRDSVNSRYIRSITENPFVTLERDTALYSGKGEIILTGDFNIRVGMNEDTTFLDKLDTTIPTRNSQDSTLKNAKLLLDICRLHQLVIANGRTLGDHW